MGESDALGRSSLLTNPLGSFIFRAPLHKWP